MQTTELGIDEAGRGPVLGPMILAGVVVPQGKEDLLKHEWNVQDSKLFGSSKKGKERRAELARKIQNEFDTQWIEVSTTEIDTAVKEKGLNRLEQQTALALIQQLPAKTVILDGSNLFKPLTIAPGITAENKADQKYLSVSAASIIAKHKRDEIFEDLCQPFIENYEQAAGKQFSGGGYANQGTFHFLKWYFKRYGVLPEFYRFSYQWKSLNEWLQGQD